MIEKEFKKVGIVLAQLRGAGIQRVGINLALDFVARGFETHILVGRRDGVLGKELPRSLEVVEIAPKGTLWFFFGLVRYLKSERPDCLLSSYEDISLMSIVANWLTGSPSFILVSTHNALSKVREEGGKVRRMKNWLINLAIRRLYRKAGALVAVSEGIRRELSELTGIPKARIRTIYNPVIGNDFDCLVSHPVEKPDPGFFDEPVIGFFGRLHPQKRVDLLISAFDKVARKRSCRLLIVGEGDEEENLRCLAAKLNVSTKVIFYGFCHNPFPLMKRCAVTVLPSDYEGLGNVLIEAMACGTQVVSTDCPYGPAEILEEGRWGQLVPVGDPGALALAIERSLDRSYWVEPEQLKQRSREFSVEAAARKYLGELGLA